MQAESEFAQLSRYGSGVDSVLPADRARLRTRTPSLASMAPARHADRTAAIATTLGFAALYYLEHVYYPARFG